MRLILSELTISVFLLLILIEGSYSQRRPERPRRQGYANSLQGRESALPQPSVRDPKPDLPALYSLPRSSDPAQAQKDANESESENSDSEIATTELSITGMSESSPALENALQMGADDEAAAVVEAEDSPSSTTAEDLVTVQPSTTAASIPSRTQNDPSQNMVQVYGGYSTSGEMENSQGRTSFQSGRKFASEQMQKFESVNQIFENDDAPRVYSVQPATQEQPERSMYPKKPSALYRQPMEIREEIVREFEPSRNAPQPSPQGGYSYQPGVQMYRHRIFEGGQGQPGPAAAQAQQQPPSRSQGQLPDSPGQSSYFGGQGQQFFTAGQGQQFLSVSPGEQLFPASQTQQSIAGQGQEPLTLGQGYPSSIESRTQPSPFSGGQNLNPLAASDSQGPSAGVMYGPPQEVNGVVGFSSADDMSLVGLENHIVDSNLLGRVQQIIEDHEREQRNFLQRYSQSQVQLQPSYLSGNGKAKSQNQNGFGGYFSHEQQSQPSSQQNNVFKDRLQSSAHAEKPIVNSQGNSFVRTSKTFPGNLNLEFQPAILSGHFVETTDEKGTKTALQQAPTIERRRDEQYLPPKIPNFQNNVPQTLNNLANIPQNSLQQQRLPQNQINSNVQQPLQEIQRQPITTQHSPLFEPSWVYRSPSAIQQPRFSPETSHAAIGPKPEFGFQPTPTSQNPGGYGLGNERSSRSRLKNSGPHPTVPEISNLAGDQNSQFLYSQNQNGATQSKTPENVNNFPRFETSPMIDVGLDTAKQEYAPNNAITFGGAYPTGGTVDANPNVVTRTIVIHEQPAGAGNGFSNHAIVTEADFRNAQNSDGAKSRPISNSAVYHSPATGNAAEASSSFPPNQIQVATASKQQELAGTGNGASSGYVYTAPAQPHTDQPLASEPLKDAPEKPKPIYGIPIAPVLGPESLEDSVIVDATQQSSNFVYSNPSLTFNAKRTAQVQNSLLQYSVNNGLSGFYSLPNSGEWAGRSAGLQRQLSIDHGGYLSVNELQRNSRK